VPTIAIDVRFLVEVPEGREEPRVVCFLDPLCLCSHLRALFIVLVIFSSRYAVLLPLFALIVRVPFVSNTCQSNVEVGKVRYAGV
jgi:hypothetical protein